MPNKPFLMFTVTLGVIASALMATQQVRKQRALAKATKGQAKTPTGLEGSPGSQRHQWKVVLPHNPYLDQSLTSQKLPA